MCALVTGVQTCALPISLLAVDDKVDTSLTDRRSAQHARFSGVHWGAIAASLILGLTIGDRKSVVSGKSGSVRVDRGGRRIINKKKQRHTTKSKTSPQTNNDTTRDTLLQTPQHPH